MKTHAYITTILLAVALPACEKKQSPTVAPSPTPTPQAKPTPTPTPIATPTPESTPVARLAPEGVLYVAKPFKVATEYGIHGFPSGKKVKLIRRQAGTNVVFDGEVEGAASEDSFTNNLDEVDAIRANLGKQAIATRKWQLQQQQAAAQHETTQRSAIVEAQESVATRQFSQKVSILKAQKDALNKRIKAANYERVTKGWPRNGGPKSNALSRGKVVALGGDASQIEKLIQARDQIDKQLRHLEAKR